MIRIAAQSSKHGLSTAGLIQAVIFEVNDRDLIGYPTPTGYRYCCTKELVPKTKCFQDRLIYQVSISCLSCTSGVCRHDKCLTLVDRALGFSAHKIGVTAVYQVYGNEFLGKNEAF